MKRPRLRKITYSLLSLMLVCGLTPAVALAEGPGGGAPGGSGGGSANTSTYDYSGTLSGTLIANGTSVTSSGVSVDSSTADVNTALCENSGTLTISGDTLTKSGSDSNGDNCNFYGINSILLGANSGSTTYISDSSLSASGTGSNGIFATDSAVVYANDDTINTTADNSRGLDATYAGRIIANLLTIATQGDHCASIATDRGGGYISVANSILSTAGDGSPILYSTGDIEVDNVTGTATGSQIAGMEGLNRILIYNSSLTSTNDAKSGSDPIKDAVIIYQSTSGDADTSSASTADFESSDSTLASSISSGAFFYCTNTTANIVLSGTTLDFDSSAVNLIQAAGNSNNWGTTGSNGATVTFTGLGETLSGNIVADTISSVNAYLLSGTTYTGATSITTNSSASSTSSAPITMNIGSDSKWVVTGNSTVTNLNIASGGSLVDSTGATVKVVNSSGTVLRDGTSSVATVTVTGSYGTTVSTSSSNALSSDTISRTAFDSAYATDTTFGSNAGKSQTAATNDIDWTRLSGSNALGTMEAIVDKSFADDSCDTVIVTRLDSYKDALTAAALAGLKNCPILFTDSSTLSSETSSEITRLGATNVIICGGTSAVSSSVEQQIEALGTTVTRLAGSDAISTGLQIYEAGKGSWGNTAIIATPNSFADALSASPYAYANDAPVFLVDYTTKELSDESLAAIEEGGFTNVIICGGSAAVSSNVESQLSSIDNVERLGGSSRYQTSAIIANWCVSQGMSANYLGVSTGSNYKDALAGAALCGSSNAPIILVDDTNRTAISLFVTANIDSITNGYIFGGTAAVSAATLAALQKA